MFTFSSCENGLIRVGLKENLYYCYSAYNETCFDICFYRSKDVLESKVFHLELGALTKSVSDYEDLVVGKVNKSNFEFIGQNVDLKYLDFQGDSIFTYERRIYEKLPDDYMLALTLKCDSLHGKESNEIHLERFFK